jgi:lysine decarboxylase
LTAPEAERRAAALYGADVCRFSAGGSTHCNQALALSVGVPGDAVVVSRTLHRSLLLGLVPGGLEPIWVEPEVSAETGLPVGYAPERVARALADHPEAKAVFLGDPSYVGTFSDIGTHATVAHEAGVPLLVDAAWAAHFGFHPALPPHALGAGADAMITSAHKTLPAYSPGRSWPAWTPPGRCWSVTASDCWARRSRRWPRRARRCGTCQASWFWRARWSTPPR